MKKAGIMQPYFFPYLGYFSLIKHTDMFILFDPVQFIRHGWIDRNRILKQNEGWLYIKVPLQKHDQQTLIKDIKIDNTQPWADKIAAQLMPYKKIAPHFQTVNQLVNDTIHTEYDDIVSLNRATLQAVCKYLGIEADLPIFSQLDLAVEPPQSPDEWALNTCVALGDIDEYWNPPGGEAFFDRSKYEQAGIKLVFQAVELQPYDQKRQPFEPGLSIIDVMMFNSPEEINAMLDKYELT